MRLSLGKVVVGVGLSVGALGAVAQDADILDQLAIESESVDRDPAAIPPRPTKRGYLGGADEDDLRVQNQIPEALVRTDARTLQREVYKNLYNQELKDDRQEVVEE